MRYVLISFFLFIFGYFGLLGPLRDFVIGFVSPVQFGLRKSAIDIKEGIKFFGNVGKVRDENLLLLQKNSELEQKIIELKFVQNENDFLRQQLEVAKRNEKLTDVTTANVLGNPNDPTQSSLFLDKGSKDKIRAGDIVIVSGSVVGAIKNVSYSRSSVELITSANSAVTVYDLNSGVSIEGVAKGRHGSSILVERILPSERVEMGDVILTSGRDGVFPQGLLVGKVSQILSDPSQPLKKAFVESSIDFTKLTLVLVVREE